MTREILFRGLHQKSENPADIVWVYGYLHRGINLYGRAKMVIEEIISKDSVSQSRLSFTIENEDTISQFTGLVDKNGKKIYEGDIIRVQSRFDSAVGTVFYNADETAFCFSISAKDGETPYRLLNHGWYGTEIIGNIFDNPELVVKV